jgi:transposase InsO family protein
MLGQRSRGIVFATIKGELLDRQAWPTRATTRRAIVEYIAWYNGARLHSTLGYRSPARIRRKQQDQEDSLTKSSALSVKAGQPRR